MTTTQGFVAHPYNTRQIVSVDEDGQILELRKANKLDNVKPEIIVVTAPDGRILMRINPDGNYHGELADASEAARVFCEAVQKRMGEYVAAGWAAPIGAAHA